jgi:heme oxygenase
MAWTYADFESQASDALRLARLRLHMAEIHAAIDANVTAGTSGVSHDVLIAKLDRCTGRLRELEARVGDLTTDDRRVSSGFTRGRCL